MGTFILGVLFVLVGIVMLILGNQIRLPGWLRGIIIAVLITGGFSLATTSTCMYVHPDEGGIVIQKFGPSLKEGHIIAVNGERGPRADVISPGWSFGWWPWWYETLTVKNKIIPQGKIGVVTALDGKPLPEGEIYAPEWKSVQEMMDARIFLTKDGVRGPQLTVLPPSMYRYNPKLYTIDEAEIVDVKMGEAAVVRANVGKIADKDMKGIELVNGVPLVPKGYRGIWAEPLLPGQFYMHPRAYEIIHAKTTKRVYSYTSAITQEAASKPDRPGVDNSIHVRTADSFQFPVDVRAAVYIEAQDMPYVVAKFTNPDEDTNKDGFDELETRAILPSIRAILRNSSETQKAVEYVNSRSKVEAATFEKFSTDMKKDKIHVEAIYLADIRLDATDEGKKLLLTQTNKEIALQEQAMYQEQVKAAEQKAKEIEASTKADQQKPIQESLAKVEIAKNEADAAKNKAVGDAAAYEQKRQALVGEGVDNLVKLEIVKLITDGPGKTWNGILPTVMIVGGNSNEALNGYFAQQMVEGGAAAMLKQRRFAEPISVIAPVPEKNK